jgi:hypothetical protein
MSGSLKKATTARKDTSVKEDPFALQEFALNGANPFGALTAIKRYIKSQDQETWIVFTLRDASGTLRGPYAGKRAQCLRWVNRERAALRARSMKPAG